MTDRVICYIALGSNLCDPVLQINTALRALANMSASQLVKHSTLYQTKPMGPQNQADFINACACIHTRLSPHQLLAQCQDIERAQGRVRTEHWGPRTIDLDILLYGDFVCHTESLTIPHPEMLKRSFVLEPLAEIAPELCLPAHVEE